MNNTDEIIERMARAIWDWEHEGRNNEILDIEWSLLKEDYLEKAKAALEASGLLNQWRPIEEAPKDGTMLQLSNKDFSSSLQGYWNREINNWCYCGVGAFGTCEPTHFMPLPSPPEDK